MIFERQTVSLPYFLQLGKGVGRDIFSDNVIIYFYIFVYLAEDEHIFSTITRAVIAFITHTASPADNIYQYDYIQFIFKRTLQQGG